MSTASVENIIVVLFENRSYDNIFGWLYNKNNPLPYDKPPPGQQDLDGLTGKESNFDSKGNEFHVRDATTTTTPEEDPCERFFCMAQQIIGTETLPSLHPYIDNPPLTMTGFVRNYELHGAAKLQDIMTYFTPRQVPVSAWLANHFAVSDQWFASAPTQTLANRIFAHCAAPGCAIDLAGNSAGFVDNNELLLNYLLAWYNQKPVGSLSVFEILDKKYPLSGTPNWKVYYSDFPLSVFVPYVFENFSKEGCTGPINEFWHDLENGTLPKYTFIEPCYTNFLGGRANSNHPGAANRITGTPKIDVADGEIFLAQIYNQLRRSRYWSKSLLVVTYDEHGCTYDHVPPKRAPSPGAQFHNTSYGFDFATLGVRVPALLVSPFVRAASTFRAPKGTQPFDHTTVIKTVWDCFDLSSEMPSLTNRDAKAVSLLDCLASEPTNDSGEIPSSAIPGGSEGELPTAKPLTRDQVIEYVKEWVGPLEAGHGDPIAVEQAT
jgi:phospholipase C